MSNQQQILEDATRISGGVAALAQELGLTPKAVYQWRARGVPTAWLRVISTEILGKKRQPKKKAA